MHRRTDIRWFSAEWRAVVVDVIYLADANQRGPCAIG